MNNRRPTLSTCAQVLQQLRFLATFGWIVVFIGCTVVPSLPFGLVEKQWSKGQLVFHSDFKFPKSHRILTELELRRKQIVEDLVLPSSDEAIHIHLFENQERFANYLQRDYAEFLDRRAFFVKSDTQLDIYAYWNDQIGEDLRHEVTHGYLHAAILMLPIWIDEGLAEYYEVPLAGANRNQPHIALLTEEFRKGNWLPNLQRLEMIDNPVDFAQRDYAEAWLWVHFLLNHSKESKHLIQDIIAEGNHINKSKSSISQKILGEYPEIQVQLLEHLRNLASE